MKGIRGFLSRLRGKPAPTPTTTPAPLPPRPAPPREPTGTGWPSTPPARKPVDIGALVTPDLVAKVRDAKREPVTPVDIEAEIDRLAARCREARSRIGAGRRAAEGAELNNALRHMMTRIEGEPEATRAALRHKALEVRVDVLVHLLNVPAESAALVLRDSSPKE